MAGWMVPHGSPGKVMGPCFVQFLPPSVLRSTQDAQALVAFDGRSANDRAVGQHKGLILDWAQDAGGEVIDVRPCPASIHARPAGAGPLAGRGTELVIKPEGLVGAEEQNGVEGGDVGLMGQYHGIRPDAVGLPGTPDGYVGLAFGCAAKPSREKLAGRNFHNRGGVAGRKGSGLVNEFRMWCGHESGREDQKDGDCTHVC